MTTYAAIYLADKHITPADSTALPAIDLVPSTEETKPFETKESAATPPPPRSPQTRYAFAPTPPSPPPSPLSPLSSPFPKILSPPLLSDIPKADMLFQKRLCLTAPASRFEVGESLTAAAARQTGHTLARRVDYGFIDTLDAKVVYARLALSRSEDRSMTHEACITSLETQIRALQRDELSPHEKPPPPMSDNAIKALVARSMADALAEHEANRNSRNGDDSYESGSGGRRTVPTTHECTYSDFLKCQPLNFKGTEEVVGLTQWFKKMEYVFHISNCAVACQIKFATCTLLSSALTRWNSHVKTVGHDAAYGMPWKTLMKMMTAKYYPRSEIKKLEIEIWNLNVKGINVVSYTQQFQELALMCGRMFLKESDEVEKYVGGLPDMIQGSAMASKPKTMQDAIYNNP
ncbi:reverse transcriptase domain-containing protein [Tanacetum coccineum]